MRHLKLSHQQIDLILQSLGIAEKQYFNLIENIRKDLINVRNNNDKYLQEQTLNVFLNHIKEFALLSEDINNGKLDV